MSVLFCLELLYTFLYT